MGWFVSIVLIMGSLISGNADLMIAAGLFAIAGVIGLKEFYKRD